MKAKKINTVFLLILLGSIVLRLIIVYSKYHTINSDNGILGLMAKHILKGEFPIFFYGQPYMGSIEAFTIAFFFLFFGISVNTMCLAMIFITCIGIISAYFLGKEVGDKTLGLYAMLIASLPPVYIFWHGLAAFGGYPETLLFGNILITIALKIVKTDNNSLKLKYYISMGLIGGLAFWTHIVIVYYILPIAIFLLINEKKKFLFFKALILVIPSFIIGSLPLWIYNIKNNFDTFKLPVSKDLTGGFIDFLNTYPQLIAGNPPACAYYLLLTIYIISFLFLMFNPEKIRFWKSPKLIFLFLFLSIIYFFSSSHLSQTRCAKYLIPMTTIIVISTAYLAWHMNKKIRFLGYILLIYVLSFNSMEIYKSYIVDKKESYSDHKLFEELINFLDENRLYTNYCVFWISQKLNFLSNEKIVNANYEGDRYIPYEDTVDASDNISFIERDNNLEPMFDMLCRNYSRTKIGPFFIYYDFQPNGYYGKMIQPDIWNAKASNNNKDIKSAFDRNVDTYWGTIVHKNKNMYFELDLGAIYKIYKISLFNNGHWRNFPLSISVEISQDGKNWNKITVPENPAPLFLSGPRLYWHLEDGRIELVFPPVSCRYIKIKQDEINSLDPWEINEIFIWEYLGNREIKLSEFIKIYNFLNENNIKNVYADFYLSAKIHKLSNGKIRTLRPINKQYPHKKYTSRFVEPDKDTAFIIDNENKFSIPDFKMRKKEFKNYTTFLFKESPKTSRIFYWSGYGMLKTNRLNQFIDSNKKEINPDGVSRTIIFKGGFKFLGYDITLLNQTLKINYFWEINKIPKGIFVFVYFMKDNKIVFQNDHPLLEQFSLAEPPKPHKIFRESYTKIFRESYTIKNIPSGAYDIVMGLYIPKKNNKRIEIISPTPKKSKMSIGKIVIL